MLERELDQAQRLDGFLVAALGLLLDILLALLQRLHVGQHQLGLDNLEIGQRIDAAGDVGDVVILEAAQDVGDGIDFADGGEELVAEAFALARPFHEASDIDEVHPRRDDLLRARDLRQHVEARLGHRHVADVGLDGAERIVRRLRRRSAGQGVEQGRLADIRQAHNSGLEAHQAFSFGGGGLRGSAFGAGARRITSVW